MNKYNKKKVTINIFSDKVLSFLIFSFPLLILFRSAIINLATILVSIIMLFCIFSKEKANFFKNKLVLYLIFFFLFFFINSIIHFTSFDLLLKSLGNFRFLLLSLGVFFFLHIVSEQKKIFFIYFNLLLILLVSIDILYQFFFYKDIFGFRPGMCDDILLNKCKRFSGVFGDELIAGSYLSQIGFLILILFLNLKLNRIYFNSLIKIILCSFLLIIILLTGERAALLIIIISIFFICFFKKKLFNFFIFLVFLFSLIFFSAQKIESINNRFVNFYDNWGSTLKNASLVNKIIESPWSYHYQAAIELFIEKPILGHGPKSFKIKCENTNIDKKTREQRHYYRDYRACSTHPHNYLLEFLSENGFLGGIFYIGLILIIFASIYKIFNNFKNKYNLITISIGSLILAIIFPFKPSGSFFSTFNASMLFYILGFFLYYLKKAK